MAIGELDLAADIKAMSTPNAWVISLRYRSEEYVRCKVADAVRRSVRRSGGR